MGESVSTYRQVRFGSQGQIKSRYGFERNGGVFTEKGFITENCESLIFYFQ